MSKTEKATREYLQTLTKDRVIDLCLQFMFDIEVTGQERDTWQKACELACRHIAEVEWLSCPETDDISESENEIKTLTKQSLNYFYQQAKKEGDSI